MKTLLDDYIFSDTLRYEGHKLIYTPENGEPIVLGGFLGAAVLGALLHGQEEGHDRGISLNNRDGRHAFFHRYEDETLHENGGLLTVEVQALSEDYMELEDMDEKYAAAREYIKERSRYDEKFRKFAKDVSHARFCRQLTLLFGWYVDPDSLRKSMLRKPKRKTKKYT